MRSHLNSRSRLVLTGVAVIAAIGLLAGCTGSGAEESAVDQGTTKDENAAIGRHRRHRVLRPRRRPRLARRHQLRCTGGRRQLRRRRTASRRGHERCRSPRSPPSRPSSTEGRRDRAAADRRRRPHRGRDQGDGGRHPGHQRRPRVLEPVRGTHHDPRRQLRHGRQCRHLHLRAARRQPRRDRRRDRRHRLAAAHAGPLRRASRTHSTTAAWRSAPGWRPTSPSRAARPRHRSCCRPTRRSTPSGTTTTTRASASSPRSTPPAVTSSS